jgi:hypothetical protein
MNPTLVIAWEILSLTFPMDNAHENRQGARPAPRHAANEPKDVAGAIPRQVE